MLRFRPRYLKRYSRIAEVLVRHGFGALVAQLGLDQALDLRQRLAPDPSTRHPQDSRRPPAGGDPGAGANLHQVRPDRQHPAGYVPARVHR